MNSLKFSAININRGIFIGMIIIPLLLIFLLHYKAGATIPEKMQDEPTVEVSPGLSNLLLKILQ